MKVPTIDPRQRMQVLLVDDDESIRGLLRIVLTELGHDVTDCNDGSEALERCQETDFNLVILDWQYYHMDGLTLCREIRSLPMGEHCMILMFTGRNSVEDLNAILQAGADDYINKPVDIRYLKVRLTIALRHAQNKMARKKMVEALAASQQREIRIASRIQQTLLIGSHPNASPGCTIASITESSQNIDGDFIDFYNHSPTCIDIVIGDVMGKGIPAALLGAAAKSCLLESISHIKTFTRGTPPKVSTILDFTQSRLTPELISLEKFITLSYMRLHLDRNEMDIVGCGHTRTIHYQHETKTCELLMSQNLPLGITENETHDSDSWPIMPGDVIVLYSDGITETKSPERELFGETRLVELVTEHAEQPPDELIRTIEKSRQAFSQRDELDDDVTCIVIRINDTAEITYQRWEEEIPASLEAVSSLRASLARFIETHAPVSTRPLMVHRLGLALTEAATNIIKHGYENQTPGHIRMEVDLFPDRVTLRLHHTGKPFIPPGNRKTRINEPAESGMGMIMMESVMDAVNYHVSPNGEHAIEMVKIF